MTEATKPDTLASRIAKWRKLNGNDTANYASLSSQLQAGETVFYSVDLNGERIGRSITDQATLDQTVDVGRRIFKANLSKVLVFYAMPAGG